MRSARVGSLIASLFVSAFALAAPTAPPDPFMGDWQGTRQAAGGQAAPLCAQVICYGKDGYQANLLAQFDTREPALAVWKGTAAEAGVTFGETGRIADGKFTGTLPTGETFELQHVTRLSPTLGLQPPEGAVELLAGGQLDDWNLGGIKPWIVDLAKLLKGDQRCAYLRVKIESPRAQAAQLEVGSDDGVKVWLNGEVVHANNTPRGVVPWQDKVPVRLDQGANVLLLKVCQGAGGWGACARIVGTDGNGLDGLTFDPAPQLPDGATSATLYGESSGTILTWQLAGPYLKEGLNGTALFDEVFAPEELGTPGVEWKTIGEKPQPPQSWTSQEGGAVQVTPGAGSITTKQQFGDFKLHLEFRSPFMPDARGQARGNSGVYLQGRWEVQVLDSYGLEGKDNECGGFYKLAQPRVNMCAPPTQWQTYDIEFVAPRYNPDTKQVDPARATVSHNGVLIQDEQVLPHPPQGGPGFVGRGPILLQDHHNQVEYRNLWVLPRD